VTRRARPVDESQLRLDLDERQHPAVEHARKVRLEAGLPQSLTSLDVLSEARRVIDPDQRNRSAFRHAS